MRFQFYLLNSLLMMMALLTGASPSARAGDFPANHLKRTVAWPEESSAQFDVIYSSVQVGGDLRRAILTVPKQQGRMPAVFVVGGLGCYTIDNPNVATEGGAIAYWQIATALTGRGFITLRIEKSGMGDSQGPPCTSQDFNDEEAEYKAGLAALKTFDRIDPSNLYVFGHSMGALHAPLLAATGGVRGVIAVGTLGQSWKSYSLESAQHQGELAGESPTEIQSDLSRDTLAMHELLDEGKTEDQIVQAHPELPDLKDEFEFDGAPYTYIVEVAALDPIGIWFGSSSAALLVHGESDFVTFGADHQAIADSLNAKTPGRATFLSLPEMDHSFLIEPSEQSSYGDLASGNVPFDRFQTGVIDAVTEWISHTRAGR